ncbi:MAG: biotin--[Alphaproteobacteria bacterium]|nr:biotin--[acetyl-CoA-carboxylase] ligase [Alphaproteobacteria bacterium]
MTISGFKIICLDEVDSTNNVALQLSSGIGGQKKVIQAKRQTAGRGRWGRIWHSTEGNLFFSVLLEFPLQQLGKLIMTAALSLLETIKQYNPQSDVCLKWPNDVLLNGAKISGILLEKGAGEYMIVGIGVNIVHHPSSIDMLYPATSLKEAGIQTTSEDFLQKYMSLFVCNIKRSAADLRQGWLKNVRGLGTEIMVKQNGEERRGIFQGIDENADLLLRIGDRTQKILAGDVFYTGEK